MQKLDENVKNNEESLKQSLQEDLLEDLVKIRCNDLDLREEPLKISRTLERDALYRWKGYL